MRYSPSATRMPMATKPTRRTRCEKCRKPVLWFNIGARWVKCDTRAFGEYMITRVPTPGRYDVGREVVGYVKHRCGSRVARQERS